MRDFQRSPTWGRRFRLPTALLALCVLSAAASVPRFPIAFAPSYDSATTFVARSSDGVSILTATGMHLPSGLQLQFIDANPRAPGQGVGPVPSVTNYIVGRGRSQWRLGIPNFSQVRFRSIYPGVDLLYHGEQGDLEYDLVISPGADPSRIRMALPGAHARLDTHGEIVAQDGRSVILQRRPSVYQEAGGRRMPIQGGWHRDADGRLRFAIGPYDAARPLVIDPVVIFATYVGGSGYDIVRAVATDAAGNAYVAGTAESADFPGKPPNLTTGPHGFVVKLNPQGTRLIYSTVFGGSLNFGNDALALAVDAGGNAYVTGDTGASDFPVTDQAFQKTFHGAYDAFIVKLDVNGAPVYSSYLGGSQGDTALGIAVDASGSAYVAGSTSSLDFPVTPGAFQTRTPHGAIVSFSTGFLAKVSPNGDALLYSTYLGGSSFDTVAAVAVDSAGNAVVTGTTASQDFPVTPGALQSTLLNQAHDDAFIAKLTPDGAGLVYSTYYGGAAGASGNAVAVDPAGNAYMGCGPLVKLDPAGALLYSKNVGGAIFGLALDQQNDIFASGNASSVSFATTANAFPIHPSDFAPFLVELNPSGDVLLATYLSPSSSAPGPSIAIAGATLVVAGSGLVIATPGAFQESPAGGYVMALDLQGGAHLDAVLNAASLEAGPIAPGELLDLRGAGFAPGTVVLFDGITADSFSNSSTDLVGPAPFTLSGSTSIQVTSNGVTSNAVTVPVVPAAPAIFPSGIRNPDGAPNSPANPAPRGSTVSMFATGLGTQPATLLCYFDGFSSPAQIVPAPTAVGTYLLSTTVPADVPVGGRVSVYLTEGTVASQVIAMAVK